KKNSFLLYSGIVVSLLSVGVTAFLVWRFDILGAAVALVTVNLMAQAARWCYARHLGCPVIGDLAFVAAGTVVVLTYLVDRAIPVSLLTRMIAFTFLSCFLF